MERNKLMPIMAAFAAFAVLFSIAAPAALAAATNVTFTVKKDTVAAANATIAVYEIESKYFGLYQKIGAYAGSATTNANGTATINGLDSAKTYLAKITYAGRTYEHKFAPATEVAISLTETSWIRGNIVPLLLGGAAVFVLLFIIAQVNPRAVRFGR
ncbi:MAG: hypothetical protein ABC596_09890 [Candidatus Methanosuratincola petrocarbonis]